MLRKLPASCAFLTLLAISTVFSSPSGILDELAAPRSYTAARVSSYDVTGANRDGGQGNPLKPGNTRVIADISGQGQIVHIWMTLAGIEGLDIFRDIVLRMYWDGEKNPSVEVPIGEFFGLSHGRTYPYESFPFVIGNVKGLNCYLPMPFQKNAKITVENVGKADLKALYYYIDYQIPDSPKSDLLYFHAQYRQEKPVLSHGNYIILDATGRGHYIGCFLFARSNQFGWWGEGDDMIYIDGSKKPVLNGTGTEDYFNQAYGFAMNQHTLRFGSPFDNGRAEGSEHSLYRFHLEDAIPFKKSIKVTMEHAFAGDNDRSDDYATVAYWYQTEPHAAFSKLAPPEARRSSVERFEAMLKEKRFDECRNWQAEIQEKSPSRYVRRTAGFNIANIYAAEGATDKAIQALQKLIDPSDESGWNARITARIKELSGNPGLAPQGNVDKVKGN
ncbi:MAG: DUF2961 domain-containing protein [Armatimonadota bacterium]|nr:DUF2961 domain-containing protein [Armatimonadota bacterium]